MRLTVLMATLACAHAAAVPRDCAPFAPPQDAQMHVASVLLHVTSAGRVLETHALNEAPPALLDAATAWLRSCNWKPEGATAWALEDVVAPGTAPTGRILEEAELTPAERDALAPADECPAPMPMEKTRFDFSLIVDATGRAELDPAKPAPPIAKELRQWLTSCPFVPLRRGGVALGARVTKTFDWDGPSPFPPPLLKPSYTRPHPLGACASTVPAMPEWAKETRTTGTVLVEYVVREDGSVHAIKLRNPTAPLPLYASVREWLAVCRMEPSRDPAGTPVAVRVIQPFVSRF